MENILVGPLWGEYSRILMFKIALSGVAYFIFFSDGEAPGPQTSRGQRKFPLPLLLDKPAYCNALLLAQRSVRQKLNHVSSLQFSYVALYTPSLA